MLKHCAWILAASLMAGPAWAGDAVFSEVRYHGDDGGPPVGADEYRNPVVAGFYPDPSITRAGEVIESGRFWKWTTGLAGGLLILMGVFGNPLRGRRYEAEF